MGVMMAPSNSIPQAEGGDLRVRSGVQRWEGRKKEGRKMSNLGRRQLDRGRRDHRGRFMNEGERIIANAKTRRFDPLGLATNFEQAASSAGKAFNDLFNPTRQASPESTISVPQADAPQPTPPPPTSTSSLPPPPIAQPTSSPQAAPPATTRPPPEVRPTSTSPAVALPIITSPAAASTTIAAPTIPAVVAPIQIDISIPVRKELPVEVTSSATSILLPSGNSIIPVANATPSVIRGDENWQPQRSSPMTPLAERLLIAAGAIGILIIIIVAFLFFLRRRGETLAIFIKRKSRKHGPRIFPVRSRPSMSESLYQEPPPKYTNTPESYKYAAVEKKIPAQRQMEGFYTPGPLPPLTIPVRAMAVPSIHSPQRQREVPPLTPDGQSAIRSTGQRSGLEIYYNGSPQSSQLPASNLNEVFIQNGLHQGPSSNAYKNATQSNTYDKNLGSNNFSPITYNYSPSSQLTRELSDSYKNTGTQNTFLSMQTSNLNSPSPQEPNRLSTISSLSSGFGDGLIIQDTDSIKYTNPQPRRESRKQRETRFSWQTTTSKTPSSDRTSTYTAASIETAPRFRTVNSWVAQQSGRVERQNRTAVNIPAMPPIPAKLQESVAPIKHRREDSDLSAFNYHPGQEIRIAPGSRVASSVLDKKLGHMSRSTLG